MAHYFKDYIIALSQLLSGKRTRGEQKIARERLNSIRDYIDVTHPQHVLDMGNGILHPQSIILESEGHIVYGIDLVNNKKLKLFGISYSFARWLYKRHLPSYIPTSTLTLVCGDVGKLPFKNDYFDLITSIAAFEHFLDIPSVIAELYRVIRPGGVAYIGIHPFTCPSGGHNVKLMEIPLRSLPKGIDAWDHLRNRKLPFHVPLNEWMVSQYLEGFSKYFEILKSYCAMREGEHFLTPEIEDELSEYSRDELTCGAYVIVARKSL